MDDYSSQANLLAAHNYPLKQQYPSKHLMVQTNVDKDAKRRKQRNQAKSGNACLLFVGVLIFATLIATTSIGAVYISHLQERMQMFEQRLKVMELKPCDCAKVRVVFSLSNS